jgi:hypothetical protein
LAKEIKQWRGEFTSSMPTKSAAWLWNLLSQNVAPATWRAGINENGIVASLHVIEDSTNHNLVYCIFFFKYSVFSSNLMIGLSSSDFFCFSIKANCNFSSKSIDRFTNKYRKFSNLLTNIQICQCLHYRH